MENMLNVYLYGKKYQVPAGLTIMTAMEYAGYELVRGCGCRNGFCGACATIYRIKGEIELHGCLACQTEIQEGMYIVHRGLSMVHSPAAAATSPGSWLDMQGCRPHSRPAESINVICG